MATHPVGFHQIPKFKITASVYTMIKEQRYDDVIRLLSNEKSNFGASRALWSLLGWCQFCSEDFEGASVRQVCYRTVEYGEYDEYLKNLNGNQYNVNIMSI